MKKVSIEERNAVTFFVSKHGALSSHYFNDVSHVFLVAVDEVEDSVDTSTPMVKRSNYVVSIKEETTSTTELPAAEVLPLSRREDRNPTPKVRRTNFFLVTQNFI